MKIVIALGGNALLARGEPLTAERQQANVDKAARAIAPLVNLHSTVITHGNGPQVGLLALQAGMSRDDWPLDVVDAESEGMIGYLIEQALENQLPGRQIATLLTQVEVDATDPGFRRPAKPVGPTYSAAEAAALETTRRWSMMPDGAGYRRAVPSPEPRRIVEMKAIRLLLAAGATVICAGGGGVPIARGPGHAFHGVEAVVDKDLCSALLARELHADALLLLTDVDACYLNWRQPDATPIGAIIPADLRKHRFAEGSMAPKVEAACRFVESGGQFAGIGRMEDALAILGGRAGTRVIPSDRAFR
jgi:carbamate kinase